MQVGNASGGAAVGEDADLREYARSLGADPQDQGGFAMVVFRPIASCVVLLVARSGERDCLDVFHRFVAHVSRIDHVMNPLPDR